MLKHISWLLVLVAILAQPHQAAAQFWPIDLSVFPRHVLRAPAEFRVRLTTPRHPANRWICWQYDGPEYKRFCWEAKGELAPRTETFWWYVRHEGQYEALASVTRIEEGRRRRYLARSSFRVGATEVGLLAGASAPGRHVCPGLSVGAPRHRLSENVISETPACLLMQVPRGRPRDRPTTVL